MPERSAPIEQVSLRSSDFARPFPAATAPATETVGFYRRVADAGATELAALIAQVAAEPPSPDRELALAVLLKRYAEIDAPRSALLAREAGARGIALESVYGTWARTAPAAALAALDAVDDPDDAAAAALALVVGLGNDAVALERVASRLAAREPPPPAGGVSPFGPGSVPFGAVAARSPLNLMAARWAQMDPERALAMTREVRDERLRLTLETAAVRTLARVAPDRAFAHLGALETESRLMTLFVAAVPELARADPERVLELTQRVSGDLRQMLETTALQQLADRDPLAATRYLERLSTGERQRLAQVVARGYGKRDAEAALAWARLQPERQNLVTSVIGGVAEENPDRALDLALDLESPTERMPAVQMVAMTAMRRDETAEAIANRLLAIDDPALQDSLPLFAVSTWASRSPDNAMRWLLANGASASPSIFQQVGQRLAMRDPRGAVAYATQVPAAAREPWIQGVVQGYAQSDPQGAIDWLRGFSGEPWYAQAATALVHAVAQRDGAAAARFVDELEASRTGVQSGAQAQQLAGIIAVNWANNDPAAAAAWAIDRRTEQERTLAVRNALGVWSGHDVSSARQWTLQLPPGALRDTALTVLLTMTAGRASSGVDPSVLNAFTSADARQRAVLQAVQGLAFADPARARTLADTHLTDPALRAQAERAFEGARNQPAAARFGIDVQTSR